MDNVLLAQRCISLSDRHILTTMAILNALLHAAAKSYGVINKISDTTYLFPAALPRILDQFSLTVPLTYIQDYLRKHWITVSTSLPTLRKIRTFLEELGIFRVEKQKFLGTMPKCERHGYQRATYHNFDLRLALEVYAQLEKIYLERGNSFESLPPHRGSFVKRLYDAVFNCSAGMNRTAGGIGTLPMTMEQAAECRSTMALATNAGTRQEIDSLEDSLDEFKKIGLDKKEPGIFEEMRSRLQELEQLMKRRMKELPF